METKEAVNNTIYFRQLVSELSDDQLMILFRALAEELVDKREISRRVRIDNFKGKCPSKMYEIKHDNY